MSEVNALLSRVRQMYGVLCRESSRSHGFERRAAMLSYDQWGLANLEELIRCRDNVTLAGRTVDELLQELGAEFDEMEQAILDRLDADTGTSAAFDAYEEALDDLREARADLGLEDDDEGDEDDDEGDEDDDEGDEDDEL